MKCPGQMWLAGLDDPESWRQVPGMPDGIEASDHGRIRNLRKRHNRHLPVLVQHQDEDGYMRVGVSGRVLLVHRLVAGAWCDGYAEGLQVNHINGVPCDNRPANLEWVTHADNRRHCPPRGSPGFVSRRRMSQAVGFDVGRDWNGVVSAKVRKR